MKTIKFRVWDKEFKKMYPGRKLTEILENTDMGQPIYLEGWETRGGNLGDDESYIFMQFTGLKDKNGKEIYEGDIVKDESMEIHKVVFGYYNPDDSYFGCPSAFVTDREYDNYLSIKMEVIGNIYENSELLKEILLCIKKLYN